MTETIYHGSSQCEKCGEMITPVAAMYNDRLCTACTAKTRKQVLKDRMVK